MLIRRQVFDSLIKHLVKSIFYVLLIILYISLYIICILIKYRLYKDLWKVEILFTHEAYPC